jgi:hypothetical protein
VKAQGRYALPPLTPFVCIEVKFFDLDNSSEWYAEKSLKAPRSKLLMLLRKPFLKIPDFHYK